MSIIIDEKTLQEAIDLWGVEAQCDMIIEECAELIQALMKMKRKSANPQKAFTDLMSELADVTIMMKQAELMFDKKLLQHSVDFKMQRLKNRVDGYKEKSTD